MGDQPEILPDIKGGSPLSQRPPGTPANPRYGSLPNLYPNYPRRPVLPVLVDSTGSISSNVTSQTLSGLPPVLPPDPTMPIPGQETIDQPVEDIYSKITPTVVSPQDIGTPNAFGGTAGITESVPRDPAMRREPEVTREDPLAQLNTSKLAEPGSPNSQAIKTTSVLNRNALFSYADYEKIKLGQQSQKLFDLSQQANVNQERRAEAMRFYHLSLQEIAQKTVYTLFIVFQELLEFFEKRTSDLSWNESAKEVGSIFTQGDRMIYLGVSFVLFSLLIMVIFLSS